MRNAVKIIFTFLFISNAVFAQFNQIDSTSAHYDKSIKSSLNIKYSENNETSFINYKKNNFNYIYYSTDLKDNNIFSNEIKIGMEGDTLYNLDAAVTNENKTFISYNLNNKFVVNKIDTILFSRIKITPIAEFDNISQGKIYYSNEKDSVFLIYSKFINGYSSGVYYRKAGLINLDFNDEYEVIDSSLMTASNPSLLIHDNVMYAVYEDQNKDISLIKSNDGIKWSEPITIIDDDFEKSNPESIADQSGKFYLFYEVQIPHTSGKSFQKDIAYKSSADNGENWSDDIYYTQFHGNDKNLIVAQTGYSTTINFISNRFQEDNRNFKGWYGEINSTETVLNIPHLAEYEFLVDSNNNMFNISTHIWDDNLKSIYVKYIKNGKDTALVELKDNGVPDDNDLTKDDDIYSASINKSEKEYDYYTFSFILVDSNDNKYYFTGPNYINKLYDHKSYYVDVNNIKLPISLNGFYGKMLISEDQKVYPATYKDKDIIYSGGFFLSGVTNGEIWSNAVAPAALIEDYIPGKFYSSPDDPINNIYVVKSNDQPFGETWRFWQKAVEQGAEYYDGDNDGKYNPVDKNGNGKWDTNEDKPILLGDFTAWSIINDNKPAMLRRFTDSQPQGIEIERTVFASGGSGNEAMKNTIFLKYKIRNTGLINDKIDSVYFGVWQDIDLGDPINDLIGTDTSLNAMFVYNPEYDEQFGTNSPAMFNGFIQGPHSYIEGVSYEDKNDNSIYDESVDVALDTAYYFDPTTLTQKAVLGAKNIKATSSIMFVPGSPILIDPINKYTVRNTLLGLTMEGDYINPCTFNYGNVFSENCADIDPRYLFSGDPVTSTGWIDTTKMDKRDMLNTGPFELNKDQPIEIIIAYVVGEGTDNINSISVARDYLKDAIDIYQTDFRNLPVNVEENKLTNTPVSFSLEQNYPNPFNPTTNIIYQIPDASFVELKIYDVMGREVYNLVNDYQNAGRYNVTFNASKLASGVYFYRLKSGNLTISKKMLLIK